MNDFKVGDDVNIPTGKGKLVTLDEDVNGVVIVLNEKNEYVRVAKCNVAPLKTPAEIEQDRIIDKALSALGHSRGDDAIVGILKQLYRANLLSDKQVKSLSYQEFEELYISTDYRPSLYKKLKPYIIQGGAK